MARDDRKEKQSSAQELLKSPLRLAIFIIALIILSLSGGALIGTLTKGNKANDRIALNSTTGQYGTANAPATAPAPEPPLYVPVKPEIETGTKAELPPEEKLATPVEQSRKKQADIQIEIQVEERIEKQAADQVEKKIEEKAPVQLALRPSVKEAPIKDLAAPILPPWKEYAVASVLREGQPKIAVVIDDVGLNGERIDSLLQLPEVATISFLPYAHNLQRKVGKVRQAGHEIMLHLPMEPTSKAEDPGPNALYRSYSKDELIRLTYSNLNIFKHYVGVNNHMGSGFTPDRAAMDIVLDILRDEGLLFLDSRTIGSSVGYELAKTKNIPTAQRDIFLDHEINEANITIQLMKTEALARANGRAIAIGHPHKLTLSMLQKWMPEAVSRGFQFIPISMAVELNTKVVTN